MNIRMLILSSAGAITALAAVVVMPVQARVAGQAFGGRAISMPSARVAVRPVFVRRHFAVRPAVFSSTFYAADSYSGGCEWLRRRARVTDNPYWWHRYQVCVGNY